MVEKITRDELDSFNELLQKEKDILERIMSSSDDIYNAYYNDKFILIQFKSGKSISSDYLDGLSDLVDYSGYAISVVTVTEEFFKLKYTEEILQITIRL